MAVAEQELREAIEKIVNELIKQGYKLPDKTNDAIDHLVDALKNHLVPSDLKNNDKTFELAFKNQLFQEYNKNFKVDHTILFTPQNQLEPKKLQEEIKKALLVELALSPKFRKMNDKEQEEQIKAVDAVADLLAKKMLDTKSDQLLCQNEKAMNFFNNSFDALAKDISGLMRQLYGVAKPGEIFRPVLAETAGNRAGIPDLMDHTGGTNFMSALDNTSGDDYTGSKALELCYQVADGSITTADEAQFEQALEGPQAASTAPTPFNTKPSPFNS